MTPISTTCRIRPVETDDLALILQWRNHPNVREFMFRQQLITKDEHLEWYERSLTDPSKANFIVEEVGAAIGVVNFAGVAEGAAAEWGFYAVPGAAKGTGQKLGVSTIGFAFKELKLNKVCGQVLEFNQASIRLHQKLGFQQEGILRHQHQLNGIYHNVVCFGLLRDEWQF